jgi:tetratricopeptide (TPR) repeat protein
MSFVQGDIVKSQVQDQWHLMKILRIDVQFQIFHVLVYEPTDLEPKTEDLPRLKVQIYHIPIGSLEGFKTFANRPITPDELQGYLTYLQMTNFPEYLKETGQNIDDLVHKAEKFYSKGNQLAEDHQFEAAIGEYTTALELIPLFYEALDNRGLTYMDIGQDENAIRDFEQSIQINPEGFTAIFSIGECFFKLKQYQKAIDYFEKADAMKPNDDITLKFLQLTKKQLKEESVREK